MKPLSTRRNSFTYRPLVEPLEDRRTPTAGFQLALGAAGADQGNAICTDLTGNVYVTGTFEGVVDFRPGPEQALLASAGGSDAYVAKFSPEGELIWVQSISGGGNQSGDELAVDPSGNLVVLGTFEGATRIGGMTLTSAGLADAFLAKLDGEGNVLFARRFGGTGIDTPSGVAVDRSGNILLTGDFTGAHAFGLPFAPSTGIRDAFVAKLDENGGVQFVRQFSGSSAVNAFDIAADDDGNVFITGEFWDSATSDGFTLISSGVTDIFVAKLDSEGDVLFARGFGSTSGDRGQALAVDDSGSVYITGGYSGTIAFESYSFHTSGVLDTFVLKLDGIGDVRYARRLGDDALAFGYDIAVDEAGNAIVTGVFGPKVTLGLPFVSVAKLLSAGLGDVFVAKWDGIGRTTMARRFGGIENDFGFGVALNSAGDVFVTGSFQRTAGFGTGSLTALGGTDGFVVQLGANTSPTVTLGDPLPPITDEQRIQPFPTLEINEGDGDLLTVTVQLNPTQGYFAFESYHYSGFVGLGGGQYEIVGDAVTVTNAVRQLVFVPFENAYPSQYPTYPSGFKITVVDAGDLSAAPLVVHPPALLIQAVNDNPKGKNRHYSTSQDVPLRVSAAQGLLKGASDPEPASRLTASLVQPPNGGRLKLNPNGSFIFTPGKGFYGRVSFRFRVLDGFGGRGGPYTVVIDILPPGFRFSREAAR